MQQMGPKVHGWLTKINWQVSLALYPVPISISEVRMEIDWYKAKIVQPLHAVSLSSMGGTSLVPRLFNADGLGTRWRG